MNKVDESLATNTTSSVNGSGENDAVTTSTTTAAPASSSAVNKLDDPLLRPTLPPYDLKFKLGDWIIVTHHSLMYKAKVLEANVEKGYFIHYDGWNSRWDEWASPDRIVEFNDENWNKAKLIEREMKAKLTKRTNSSASNSTASSKRKRETNPEEADDAQEEDGGDASAHVKLNLSDELKMVVVRDWEHLTQNKKLVLLPKPENKTVEKILEDFLATKKKADVFSQITQGLIVYFDRALPSILLYRSERAQQERLRTEHPDKRNSQLYGGEHLLRLFVRLPQLLVNTDLDENETKQLCSRLQDFLRFLSKKSNEYFGGEDTEGYIDDTTRAESGEAQ